MPTVLEYIQTFIIAGTTVTGISLLGNEFNPALGGILSGIPISIPSMLLINSVARQKKFILSANIMVALLSVVTCLCWYLYNRAGWKNYQAVALSIFVWFLGGLVYYFYLIKK